MVVGAGIAGLTAALSAAQAGARTIVLEKGLTYNVRGLHNAAITSNLQKKAGIKIDRDRIISTIMEFGDYRSDQRLVRLWDGVRMYNPLFLCITYIRSHLVRDFGTKGRRIGWKRVSNI